MSYILEALKKAQAERQLGSAPTIHAVPLHAVAGDGPQARVKPLWIGLGVGLLLAGAGAVFVIRQPSAPPVVPVPVRVAAAPAPAPAGVPAAVAPPVQALPKAEPPPKPRPAPKAALAAPVKKSAPPVKKAEPAAAPEDSIPVLAQLPEAIRREVPPVAIGGYIYAKNPADSLLLVDKILRREGDQLASGLVLEKLLPKAAVMNYRGYRFRVPY